MKTMIFEPFSVVVVPFPFTDAQVSKFRKAVVISKPAFQSRSETMVLAMITSARGSDWPGDVQISDLKSAGLQKACVARLKLFTLDDALIDSKVGKLSDHDQSVIRKAWGALLAL
jgi:mRNA interferase MazF